MARKARASTVIYLIFFLNPVLNPNPYRTPFSDYSLPKYIKLKEGETDEGIAQIWRRQIWRKFKRRLAESGISGIRKGVVSFHKMTHTHAHTRTKTPTPDLYLSVSALLPCVVITLQ